MKKLFFILISATLFACNKDKDENKFDLDDFFDKHKPKEQVFSFNSGGINYRSDTTEKGGTIKYRYDFFWDKNRDTVVGNIKLRVTEIYSKSDIILGGMHTLDNFGNILKSRGMIKVSFESNGEKVAPVDYGLELIIPINMDYYYRRAKLYALQADSTWNKDPGVSSIGYLTTDSISSTEGKNRISIPNPRELLIDYEWLNCDDLIDTPYTTVKVYLTSDSINIYKSCIVMKNYMAAVNIYYSFADSALVGTNIPVAEPVTVIVIGTNAEGVVYAGVKDFTVTENISVDVPLSPTTEEELLAAIRALD